MHVLLNIRMMLDNTTTGNLPPLFFYLGIGKREGVR